MAGPQPSHDSVDAAQPPQRLGRYFLVSELGAGAQGTVYRAYDPDLDRKVAIKLLRPELFGPADLEAARARALREAQAMARLSHPNVVPVHDVGTCGDRLFVAMEYVDGQTLRQWLRQQPRNAAQILEKFLNAGRGIAAAHEVGLLHRDFKPENVLVDRSGNVKVTDFGLARSAEDAPCRVSESVQGLRGMADLPTSSPLDQALTQAGARVGTPAYMAPEQFLGLRLDARTEQFNFCAALWEALYGQRAFSGDTYEALASSVTVGEVRLPQDEGGVPARIRGVLLRGLSREREMRFASFQELLGELARDPRRQRRPWLLAGGAIAALATMAGGAALWQGRRPEPCPDPRPRFEAVWNAAEREAVRAAFAATGAVMADFAAHKVTQMFDEDATRWVTTWETACREARMLGIRSPADHARQTRCLQRHLDQVRTTVASLRTVDARAVGRAQQAVLALPKVDACLDPRAEPGEPEAAEAARSEQFIALQEQVDRMRSDFVLGMTERVLETGQDLADRAAAAGHLVAQAEVLHFLGLTLGDRGRWQEAFAAVLGSLRVAEEAGMDALRVRALMSLGMRVRFVNPETAHQEAAQYTAHAEAVIRRMERRGSRVDDLYAALYNGRSYDHYAQGEYELAAEAAEAALRHLQNAPDGFAEAQTLDRLTAALLYLGRPEQALSAAQRGLERVDVMGPAHLRVGMLHTYSAAAFNALGRHPEAEASANSALDVFRQAGWNSPLRMFAALELATALAARDLSAAEDAARRSVDGLPLHDGHFVDEHCQQAVLGTILLEAGRAGEAAALFAEGIAFARKQMGADHPDVAEVHAAMGLAQEALGQRAAAEQHFRRALEIFERAFSPQHPSLIRVLSGLGRVRLGAGAEDEARGLLERAVAVPARPVDLPHVAHARLGLASLARSGGDPQQALRLARQAREDLVRSGRDSAGLLKAEATIAALAPP
jgi:eukaryotic-like serine/threonine-protein kinase